MKVVAADLSRETVAEKPYIADDHCDYAYVPIEHMSRCHYNWHRDSDKRHAE
jgi:hypothetical protein